MAPKDDGSQAQFGMDHRAIVWCHNLLSEVHHMIQILVTVSNTNSNANERLQRVREQLLLERDDGGWKMASTYADRLAVARDVFRVSWIVLARVILSIMLLASFS